MKRILVPTDFSECAGYAVDVAASIAKKFKAEVFLLHVIDIPYNSNNYQFAESQDTTAGMLLMEYARKQFKKLLAQSNLKGVKVKEAVHFASSYEKIVEDADGHGIDLIIMGTHGTKGVQEFLIGSTTERVARHASCPVLAIKSKIENFDIKNLVFASNFFSESERVFAPVKKFIEAFGANLHLLKVITPGNFKTTSESRKVLKEFKHRMDVTDCTTMIWNDKTLEDGILNYGNEIKADLIAMGTHGRTGLAHVILGSVTEDLINHSPFPVMSIKIKQAEV